MLEWAALIGAIGLFCIGIGILFMGGSSVEAVSIYEQLVKDLKQAMQEIMQQAMKSTSKENDSRRNILPKDWLNN